MKKQLLVIALISGMIFGCEKQASKKLAPINGIEFKTKYGFELPYLDYGNGNLVARGKKTKASVAELSVTDGDLVLSNVSGNDYTSTVSENAEWGGFQDLTDTVGYCPKNWSNVVADPSMNCTITVSGVTLRTFTSDKGTSATAYDVHLSNLVTSN